MARTPRRFVSLTVVALAAAACAIWWLGGNQPHGKLWQLFERIQVGMTATEVDEICYPTDSFETSADGRSMLLQMRALRMADIKRTADFGMSLHHRRPLVRSNSEDDEFDEEMLVRFDKDLRVDYKHYGLSVWSRLQNGLSRVLRLIGM